MLNCVKYKKGLLFNNILLILIFEKVSLKAIDNFQSIEYDNGVLNKCKRYS